MAIRYLHRSTMSAIEVKTDQRIKETISRMSGIQIDGSKIYLASYQGDHYVRYVEDANYVTFSAQTEKNEHLPFIKLLSNAFTGLSSRRYVIQVENPLSWDNETEPLPDRQLRVIVGRVEGAVLQKYADFRVDLINQQ